MAGLGTRFVSILSGRAGQLLLAMMITPVLVRLLGVSRYGEYAVMMSILGLSMIAINSGVFDGIRKYIAEGRPTYRWTENVFAFYSRVGFALSLLGILVVLLAILTGYVDRIFGSQFRPYFYILCVLILAVQTYQIGRGTLMGLGKETYSEPFVVIHKALFGFFAVFLAWANYGVSGVLAGYLLATVICATGVFLFVRRSLPLSSVTDPIRTRFPRRQLLSFNGLSILLVLLMTSLYHVDILLLQPLAGSEQTGYYKAALVVAEFLWFAPFAVQLLLLQSSSQLWATNQIRRITELASRVTRYTLLLTLLLMIGIAVLAGDFVTLYYGPEFAPAVVPLLLLLPGAFGFAIVRPILAIGQGRGELRVLIAATGVAALINLGLNIVLIPLYGMYGAAVATSIGYGSMFLLHVRSARWIGFDPLEGFEPRPIAITAAVAGLLIFGFASVVQSPLYSLLLVPPFGFVVFVAAAIATGAIEDSEIQALLRRIPIDVRRRRKVRG
ncbi:MAG: oligosaccharide flippase family protein [Halalkalicoccus sp.]